jgi:hypothetical protein
MVDCGLEVNRPAQLGKLLFDVGKRICEGGSPVRA